MWVSSERKMRIVEIVDRGVALDHRRRLLGVARGEGVEHVVDHLGGDPRHFRQQRDRPDPAVLDARHPLGDILGIVADPLDHAGDLQRRDRPRAGPPRVGAQRPMISTARRSISVSSASIFLSRRTTPAAASASRRTSASIASRIAASASPPISQIVPRSVSSSASSALPVAVRSFLQPVRPEARLHPILRRTFCGARVTVM